MKKESIKRTSYYRQDKTNYLSKDGTKYIYRFMELDENGKYVPTTVEIDVTEDTIEFITILDKLDHEEDLQERHIRENTDWDFLNKTIADDKKDGFIERGLDSIPDKRGDIYEQLYAPLYRNLKAEKDVKKLKENMSEDQLSILEERGVYGKTTPEICKEMNASGKDVTVDGLESRWYRARIKAAELLHIELPKRKYMKNHSSSK